MKYSTLAVLIILGITKTTVAGSGFEPVISGVVDDIVNKTVSNGTIDKTSDRLSKFGDVYGSAKAIPENIKEAAGGTKTTEAKPKKKGLTFWQKIDRLIMRARNSNY
jgi:hypothetical protein